METPGSGIADTLGITVLIAGGLLCRLHSLSLWTVDSPYPDHVPRARQRLNPAWLEDEVAIYNLLIRCMERVWARKIACSLPG